MASLLDSPWSKKGVLSRKYPPEIHFTYLGNKEVHLILETRCIISALCLQQNADIIIIIVTHSIQFSLCGSRPYTSTDKTNNIHKRNNTKTQNKQYKTQ